MADRQSDLAFEWDAENVSHIARHNIEPIEAEECFHNDPLMKGYEMVNGEDRWTAVGATFSLRILVLIFTVRDDRIRVITGWNADKLTTRDYFKAKGD